MPGWPKYLRSVPELILLAARRLCWAGQLAHWFGLVSVCAPDENTSRIIVPWIRRSSGGSTFGGRSLVAMRRRARFFTMAVGCDRARRFCVFALLVTSLAWIGSI
jgi:hypothetical protein